MAGYSAMLFFKFFRDNRENGENWVIILLKEYDFQYNDDVLSMVMGRFCLVRYQYDYGLNQHSAHVGKR